MAKLDLQSFIGTEHIPKSEHKYKVLAYLYKDKANHVFEVQFLDTKNIQAVTLNQIRNRTVIDLVQRKKLKRIKTENELKERNRLVKKTKINYNLDNINSKTILSIDASTTSTGIAYAEKGVIKRSKVIKCDAVDFRERIFVMANEIRSILSKKKFDAVIIESTFLGLNSKILSILCELRGAIVYQVYNENAELIEIPPVKWKHYYNMPTGRAEQKKFSIEKAQDIMGYRIETDDEADAVCMLNACLNIGAE